FYTNDASDALQIGPDGKIYVARGEKSFLAVINNPNQQGLSCNFQDSTVSLNNEMCNFGLPNLIDNYSYSNSTIKCPSGVYEIENQDNYFIYPNPFCQYAILEFKNPKNEKHNLSVYNTLGQLLLTIDNITTG